MITVAEYIASENLSGVQSLAQKLGYPTPKTSREGHLFLKSLHIKDPESAKKYYSEIHPDRELVFDSSFNNMVVEPMTNPYNNASGCTSCGMINATGCGCGGFKNATDMADDVLNKLENTANKGMLETERTLNQSIEKVKEMIDKKDDRIFKYGMVLLAGVLIGKFILK